MVKVIIVLIAINVVFHFSVHNQRQNNTTIVRTRTGAGTYLSITVVKLIFTYAWL